MSGIAVGYILSFGLPLAGALLATPLAGRIARRLAIIDHPKEGRFHASPTPYLGGLAVAGGVTVVGVVTAGASGQLLTVLLCALSVAGIGFLDDWRKVGPLPKLAVEIGAGLALWFAGVTAGFFHVYLLDLGLTVLWVVAITNAFNLIDNMDGLSSGVAAIAALAYFSIAAARGDYLVASFALAIAGASFGFLRYNFPPARIFLGDGGSLLLGFLLSALALKLDLVGAGGLTRAAVPALILGVPIFDTLLVILSRLREHRPIYVGGTDHSSHRLSGMGYSPGFVALAVFSVQSVACGVALWIVDLSAGPATILSVSAVGVAGLAMWAFLFRTPSGARDAPVQDADPVKSPLP